MVSRLMVIILFVWFATAGLLMVRLTTSFDISSSRFITEAPGIAVITDEKVLGDDSIVLTAPIESLRSHEAAEAPRLDEWKPKSPTGRRSELGRSRILQELVREAQKQENENKYTTVSELDSSIDESASQAPDNEILIERAAASPFLPAQSTRARPSGLSHKNKYLLYAPSGQLNNQRYCLMDAIAFANALNRTLVLPYLYFRHNYLARTGNIEGHDTVTISYSRLGNYFDLNALSNVVQWVDPTLEEIHEVCGFRIQVHQIGFYDNVPSRYYRRLGFRITSPVRHDNGRPKWTTQDAIDGMGSIDDTCLSLSFIFERFDFNREPDLYIRARQSVVRPPVLSGNRHHSLTLPNRTGIYTCLGMVRGQEWNLACLPDILAFTCVAIRYAVAKIKAVLRETGLNDVFLATSILESEELNSLVQGLQPAAVYMHKRVLDIAVHDDGNLISMIDQYLCAQSTEFIGSSRSTFSTVIHEERKYILNKPWGTDF